VSTTRGILLVSNFLSSAELNRGYSEELADRLVSRGWAVTRTSSLPSRPVRLLDMVKTAIVRRNDYARAHVDVFSGAAFVWAEAVCAVLERLGKPFALTLRGGALPEFAARWPRRVQRLLGSAVAVTVPSEYLGQRMKTYRNDLSLIRNAIDLGVHSFHARPRPRPRLIWLRAFHEIYNPSLAIRVLAILAKRFPEVTLTMVGPDKDGSRATVDRLARETGVSDRLRLVGRVDKSEVPMVLASGDVFLNTTDIDNMPVSVLEALAGGLCVVSTNVGGLPFMLQHEQTALLVRPRDANAMADAISRLLTDSDLAGRLSRGARDYAMTCDWSHVLDQWDHLFSELRC
jgi:glycosyltransferase involved in cell wall biosynthesis